MNWADYQPGRRVVCVEDMNDVHCICSVLPEKGKVYTIRAANMGRTPGGVETLGLTFVEFSSVGVPNARIQPICDEWWFRAQDFKPLDERRLDQFRQHLTKTPAPFAYGGVDA
ncbi:hypothetical protein GOZ80_14210 [Agrobacterium vitis]|uniref:hypothetical protein n=1 Tax=Agrobacterium vitis TaxID=373 RepID=UPI0008DC0AD9|nr:hypothetical protein [Agrobacterium vitis]MUO96630.1 hypothetical protein [Agrobacterium vitis]MVA93161.1 hypothetical protein [Agrobacterium vitis]MVB03992.1 hypothetical protein [Agrobacterium vitis]